MRQLGENYGTMIKDWRIESRALFVVDQNYVVQYVDYVPEVAEHPNTTPPSPSPRTGRLV